MYTHLVLWRIKGRPAEKPALAREIKRRLESLPGAIPEIRQYEVGINIGRYDASFFDVGLVSRFDDRAAFERYIAYPKHDEVVAYISSVTEAEEIVDYEA
jgi:hypothetical protein